MTEWKAIAAVSKDRYVSKNGELPWSFPIDFAQWTHKVRENPVVLGRKTFEQIPPNLTEDHMYVLSRSKSYPEKEYVTVCKSKEELLHNTQDVEKTIYVLGGGQIYQLLYDLCDTLILTEVDEVIDGDSKFPEYEQHFSEKVNISIPNKPYTICYYNRHAK